MKKSVAIIGGGPAAMLCASFLDETKYEVTIYEKNKTLGRKFLVAGKGGFNLTHSEKGQDFVDRYTPSSFLEKALKHFTNTDLQNWLDTIGIPTFVGSSGRIYPEKGIKPIEVLNAITKVIETKNVQIKYNQEWKGWSANDELIFADGNKVKSDVVILALGGGSWQVTGSSGAWLSMFQEKGILTKPFYPSNCAYEIKWERDFIAKHAGSPLKNIAITCDGKTQKGESVILPFGLEGNAIYGLSPQIRSQLLTNNSSRIFMDLKPMLSEESIRIKIRESKYSKITDVLKKVLKLDKTVIELLKSKLDKATFLDQELLIHNIKNLPLEICATATLEEAISSVGGITLDEVDEYYQFDKMPNHYCLGEMLDWDAPTGGYLLQACFSMGVWLADGLNKKG